MRHRIGWKSIGGIAALLALPLVPSPVRAWGPTGHKIINGMAADSLPTGPLRDFMLKHRSYLVDHSSDPDHWRDISSSEGYHHFMDADRYGKPPFLNLPRSREEAERRFGVGVVLKNGVVPWSVNQWFLYMVDDLRSNNLSRALMDAAVMGHYAGDSHVPFHAVENYDGQLTGQKGIHARFESMLVDQFIKEETLKPTPVRYIDNPASATMSWLVESAEDAPLVLAADEKVHARAADYESNDYRKGFWQEVGPIVTERLEEGAGDLASLWQSAWIVAGKPALDGAVTEIQDTAVAANVPHDRKPR